MSTLPESDPFAFNDRLRAVYDETPNASATLPPRIWEGVQPHLQPAAPVAAPRRAPLLAGAGGLVVGILLTWGLKPGVVTGPVTANRPAAPAVISAGHLPDSEARLASSLLSPSPSTASLLARGSRPGANRSGQGSSLASPPSYAGKASAIPVPVRTEPGASASAAQGLATTSADSTTHGQVPPAEEASAAGAAFPTVLRPLVQAETMLGELGRDTTRASRESRRAALLTERAALTTLTLRTDSLLRALDGAALLLTPTAAPADSGAPASFRRWSVVLAGAPELSFLSLQAPAADTLAALRRTHEQGRAGYNAALLAEYRLSPRWSVVAGAGLSSTGAELRLTDRRTLITTRLDSTIIQSIQDTQITTRAYSLRIVQEPQLSPIVNFNNQIIGYDTVLVERQDTVWTR